MPLTTLDLHTALIVVDLQKGLRDIPSVHPMASVIDHYCQLIEAIRKQKLPVVLVNAHEYSLKHVFPRLGETCSTQDLLDLLAKRSA